VIHANQKNKIFRYNGNDCTGIYWYIRSTLKHKKNFVQILILLTQGKWVPWLFGPKIHRPGCHRADLAATIPTALALLIPRRWLRLRSMSHHASCSSLSNSTQPRWANIIGSLGSGFLFIHGEIYHIYNTTRFLSLSLTVLSLSHYYSTV
jgi:hypothetical protein